MPYRIRTYIPVEAEDVSEEDFLSSAAEAESEIANLSEMQPENVYEVYECDEEGKEV